MRRVVGAGSLVAVAVVVVVGAVAGCAGPFDAVKAASSRGGVALLYCGSASTSPESVMKSLEPPSDVPSEVGGNGGVSAQEELRVCIKLENKGDQPARVDRSYIQLKCPH